MGADIRRWGGFLAVCCNLGTMTHKDIAASTHFNTEIIKLRWCVSVGGGGGVIMGEK